MVRWRQRTAPLRCGAERLTVPDFRAIEATGVSVTWLWVDAWSTLAAELQFSDIGWPARTVISPLTLTAEYPNDVLTP